MEHNLLTIYIDLDHTLIDTDAYKDELARSLRPFGVTRAKFFADYKAVRMQGFAIGPLIKRLIRDEAKQKVARAALLRASRTAGLFLYPDVLPFLRAMRRKNVRLILYSWGDRAFQNLKLKSMPRLTSFFRRIMITEDPKKQLPLPVRQGTCLMIDDRSEVLSHYARKYGVLPILILRGGSHVPGAFPSLRAVERMLHKRGLMTF